MSNIYISLLGQHSHLVVVESRVEGGIEEGRMFEDRAEDGIVEG